MDGTQKLFAIFWPCLALVLMVAIVSISSCDRARREHEVKMGQQGFEQRMESSPGVAGSKAVWKRAVPMDHPKLTPDDFRDQFDEAANELMSAQAEQ